MEIPETALRVTAGDVGVHRRPFTIRPERPADFAAVHLLVSNAFARAFEADLIDSLRTSDAYLPGLALVAVDDRGLLGHIMITRIEISLDAGGTLPTTILAPLAVAPEHQQSGIGTALTNAALAAARAAGHCSMVLVGHPTYYPRFGFRPASSWNIRYSQSIPDDVFMAIELVPNGLSNANGVVGLPAAFDEG